MRGAHSHSPRRNWFPASGQAAPPGCMLDSIGSTLGALKKLHGQSFDAVVTSLGVNDVTAGVVLSKWQEQQRALRTYLHERKADQCLAQSGGYVPRAWHHSHTRRLPQPILETGLGPQADAGALPHLWFSQGRPRISPPCAEQWNPNLLAQGGLVCLTKCELPLLG